jgi:hypothetical protein
MGPRGPAECAGHDFVSPEKGCKSGVSGPLADPHAISKISRPLLYRSGQSLNIPAAESPLNRLTTRPQSAEHHGIPD